MAAPDLPTFYPTAVCDDSDRPAWLEARRTGIGGSDCPAILGISPFSSPARVAAEKLGLIEQDSSETELMTWGRKVEPLLIEAFKDDMERAGRKGWLAKLSGKLYRSTKPGREVMLATLDGVAVDPDGRRGTIECKLKVFGASEWEREGVPDYVIAQGQHNTETVDADFCIVIGLLDGYRPRWKIIERNRDLIEGVIVPAELAFWAKVQAGEAFPLDSGPADANIRLARRLYPEDSGETIRLKGELYVDAAKRWREAAEQRLAFDKREEQAKAFLIGEMKTATFAELDNGTMLSLKTTRKEAAVVKAHSFRTLREVGESTRRKLKARKPGIKRRG